MDTSELREVDSSTFGFFSSSMHHNTDCTTHVVLLSWGVSNPGYVVYTIYGCHDSRSRSLSSQVRTSKLKDKLVAMDSV